MCGFSLSQNSSPYSHRAPQREPRQDADLTHQREGNKTQPGSPPAQLPPRKPVHLAGTLIDCKVRPIETRRVAGMESLKQGVRLDELPFCQAENRQLTFRIEDGLKTPAGWLQAERMVQTEFPRILPLARLESRYARFSRSSLGSRSLGMVVRYGVGRIHGKRHHPKPQHDPHQAPPEPALYLGMHHDTNSDPGNRLTEAEVALLASAGFFNFQADGRAFISPRNLRTAVLIPNTDARTPDEIANELNKPFVIQLGSNFFTLTFRGAGGRPYHSMPFFPSAGPRPTKRRPSSSG